MEYCCVVTLRVLSLFNITAKHTMNPTQEKSTTPKCKTIESKIWDSMEREFPIEITYDYSDYYGWDKWEVSVWGFDYKISDSAYISPKDLSDLIKDIIREEEGCHVTFY